jgi:hypothetical protein
MLHFIRNLASAGTSWKESIVFQWCSKTHRNLIRLAHGNTIMWFSYSLRFQNLPIPMFNKSCESKRPRDSSSEVWFSTSIRCANWGSIQDGKIKFSLHSAQLVVDIFSDGSVHLVVNRITHLETGDQRKGNIIPFHFYNCTSVWASCIFFYPNKASKQLV